MSVGHGLVPSNDKLCFICRAPLTVLDQLNEMYEEGVSCQYCYDTINDEKRSKKSERQYQIKLAQEVNDIHLGKDFESLRKSRKNDMAKTQELNTI